jgi:hypothetical protein
MIVITILILILVILFIFGFKIFYAKNYLALLMFIPYILYIICAMPSIYSEYGNLGKVSKVEIDSMKLLNNMTIEESLAFMMNSKVTFGDGLQCAGGLISLSRDTAIEKILKSKSIENKHMALIWLMNSKASQLSLQGNLLFVSDQKKADPGIWIGWVDEKEVSKIKRMDGTNQ